MSETPGKTGGGGLKLYLGRLPAVYLVPRTQLTVAVISLHENPSKFIHQAQVVVTQGTAEHLWREAAGLRKPEPDLGGKRGSLQGAGGKDG